LHDNAYFYLSKLLEGALSLRNYVFVQCVLINHIMSHIFAY